ncbi:MAG: lytic transglycosylase domain-containing protein [Pseudomonadota bacterium]
MARAVSPLFLSLALLGTAVSAVASPTYLYRQADGTVLHTDRPPHRTQRADLTLLKVIRPASPVRTQRTQVTQPRVNYAQCTGVRSKTMRERASAYEDTIEALAERFKVSKHLVMAVVAAESCFDQYAVSRAGAAGLMQLMPATARSLGVVDPFNTEQNLRAGIQYLSQLAEEFDYNHKLVLAAYNAGPGNVRKYKGIPPFSETRTYVTRVMANYLSYLQMPAE